MLAYNLKRVIAVIGFKNDRSNAKLSREVLLMRPRPQRQSRFHTASAERRR